MTPVEEMRKLLRHTKREFWKLLILFTLLNLAVDLSLIYIIMRI